MRRIATFLAVLLISSSALAQTPISDTKTENSQSHHGLGDAVLSTSYSGHRDQLIRSIPTT